MAERVEMLRKDLKPGSCASDLCKDILQTFRERDAENMERILVNSEVNINHRYGDPHHGTLLDLCAMEGCTDLVSLLLEHGAQPNEVNPIRKKAPIHFASKNGDVKTLNVLVKHAEINLDVLDGNDNTALHYAVKHEDITAVNLLIDHGANLNCLNCQDKTPLHRAMDFKNKEAIITLVNAGADLSINGPKDRELRDELATRYPDIPLPILTNTNDEKPRKIEKDQLFRLLRALKFDEFLGRIKDNTHLLENSEGCHTFLQYSCEYGFEDVVKALLEMGASPNTTTPSTKLTPLMLASKGGYVGIVRVLTSRSEHVDFKHVRGETPLHCIMTGIQFPAHKDSDYLECLKLLLTKVPKSKLNINQQDVNGNTALHYAAKFRQHKMVLLLLQHGAYIGMENVMGEAACDDISFNIFSEHLDSCIGTNDVSPRENNYEITFKYDFLLPTNWSEHNEPNYNSDPEINISVKKYPQSETMPLLHIANNRELRPLLKHPIFTSFLHLKWHRIRNYFFINLCFYLLFWAFLTAYIFGKYTSNDTSNAAKVVNSTTTPQINVESDYSPMWFIVTLLLVLLFLRELFQLYLSPVKYLSSPENWLEIGIIIVTFIILFCKGNSVLKHQISAIGIMLSWSELVLLIGRHPALSTNIEMLKTVSYTFLKFLAWYSILIIAFALSFYSLFKDSFNGNEEEENFFEDPGISIFKTVVMLTGEFEAGSIPFLQYPITSHILFVLFVFMIAIVLFNLLNGLAVSDTQAIRSDAELVSVVSRAKLVSYLETTLANPSTIIEALSRFLAHKHKPISSINLAPSLPTEDCSLRVSANKGNEISSHSFRSSSNIKRDPTQRCDPCPTIFLGTHMDSSVVERASHILKKKSERQALIQAQEEEKERERLLREELKQIRHCINNLTEMFQENKSVLDNIFEALATKDDK